MNGFDHWALSAAIFVPIVGALVLVVVPRSQEPAIKAVALLTALATDWRSPTMSNVCPPLKYSARKLRIINADPNSVNRKNLIAAYCRLGPPHTPIMKYMGSSTSSKKTKNRMRSSDANVPFMPVASTRIRIRKALGLCGSGKWSHE